MSKRPASRAARPKTKGSRNEKSLGKLTEKFIDLLRSTEVRQLPQLVFETARAPAPILLPATVAVVLQLREP